MLSNGSFYINKVTGRSILWLIISQKNLTQSSQRSQRKNIQFTKMVLKFVLLDLFTFFILFKALSQRTLRLRLK